MGLGTVQLSTSGAQSRVQRETGGVSSRGGGSGGDILSLARTAGLVGAATMTQSVEAASPSPTSRRQVMMLVVVALALAFAAVLGGVIAASSGDSAADAASSPGDEPAAGALPEEND